MPSFEIKDKKTDFFILSDFTLYKPKNYDLGQGVTPGGFYYAENNQKWLIKEGHYDWPLNIVNEYVAGALFQHLLADNAPQTELVINDSNASLMIGSKIIPEFQSLYDRTVEYDTYLEEKPYGEDFPYTFYGKPIVGFTDVIAAILFLGDTDAHECNVGLIDHGDDYSYAKVDHGFSFSFGPGIQSLDDVRYELNTYYDIKPIEIVEFDDLLHSVSTIADLDFSKIEDIVHDKMQQVKNYMEVLSLTDLEKSYSEPQIGNLAGNLQGYEENLLAALKDQQQNFQQIASTMQLEKAILEHDYDRIQTLCSQGMNLDKPFAPFYNATSRYGGDEHYFISEPITGLELAEQQWPELLLFAPNSAQVVPQNGGPINMQEVFIPGATTIGDKQSNSTLSLPAELINSIASQEIYLPPLIS